MRVIAIMLAALGIAQGAAPAGEIPLATELVTTGLTQPIYVKSAPGEPDRLYVVEQNSGQVRIVQDGQILPTSYLSAYHLIENNAGEQGLLGLAFHPDYPSNGYSYVSYTDLNGDSVVARYTRSDINPDIVAPSSHVVLLTIPQDHHAHNAGTLQFGLDGYLYVGVGDGGFGFDPPNNALNLDDLRGKILRLDVDGGFPYAIPPTNPFVGPGDGARDEIWLYGLRNPWQFSFDRETGDLWIGDVGQQVVEEIDFYPAGSPGGDHFGWRCFEGPLCTGALGCDCDTYPYGLPPIHYYVHDDGCAVIGGYVYRGCSMPELRGTYVFADFCGRAWSLRYDGNAVIDISERTNDFSIGNAAAFTSFGEDSLGELYFTDYLSGSLYRIVRAVGAAPDCNGNGAPDGCEAVLGTVNDINQNEIPDPCELLLEGTPLTLGQPFTLTFVGAEPGETVYLILGLSGAGRGPCFYGENLCLDVLPPITIAGVLPATAEGSLSVTFGVPTSAPPLTATFQCVLWRGAFGSGSVLSNPHTQSIQP